MSEEKSREYFELYYNIQISDENEQSKDIAWSIWEKSRTVSEILTGIDDLKIYLESAIENLINYENNDEYIKGYIRATEDILAKIKG